MRPVTVFKRVHTQEKGWETVESFKGKFHHWGMEIWEQDGGSINYSVAIIERADGQIETVPPHLIRFDDVAQEGGAA